LGKFFPTFLGKLRKGNPSFIRRNWRRG